MEIPYQLFGSSSSEDLDVVFFVTELGSIAENSSVAKTYAAQLAVEIGSAKVINPNLAIVSQGALVKVYKGTVDELNNALYHTYALHTQMHPLQITQVLPRDVELKIIRCTRTVLSYFSRTEWREMVKKALAGDIRDKFICLQQLNIGLYGEEVNGIPKTQFLKTVAFQMGQTLALMEGVECYTKETISGQYPQLQPYLIRHVDAPVGDLQQFWDMFLQRVAEKEPGMLRRRE